MDKQSALINLRAIRNSYYYGLVLRFMDSEDGHKQLLEFVQQPLAFKTKKGNVQQVDLSTEFGTIFADVDDAQAMACNFELSLLRMLYRDPFEVAREYLEKSKQTSRVSRLHWYAFGRLLRNATSHETGLLIVEWPERKKNGVMVKDPEPIAWGNWCIYEKDLPIELVVDHVEALLLFEDIKVSLEKELD